MKYDIKCDCHFQQISLTQKLSEVFWESLDTDRTLPPVKTDKKI